ncbi:L-serine ammonia-lyase [Paludibaculum fermentans]|uniref:L-serine dehydratase n=1 Tax=Paludibaculum fermentans TaxID=1473598 RepID=A0A7S7NM79_PALFE|nr:L-serine ammonia-lyase [Paludibaculum fermentans]QOY85709.1 L-serine ammonia-lyase [Paludibaculum fermentans]
MRTSLFDLFKIGIGPSSSHTVGPMRAAYAFVRQLDERGLLPAVRRIRAELYGSLALTGRGHGTDRGILLGWLGEQPDGVDPAAIGPRLAQVEQDGRLLLLGSQAVEFAAERDLVFHMDMVLPGHPNAVRFSVLGGAGEVVDSRVYYSVGGGFIREEGKAASESSRPPVPYPFQSGAELLERAEANGLTIAELMLANELAWRSETEVRGGIQRIWGAMQQCTQRGLETEGVLPGGLNVTRRAASLVQRLAGSDANDPLAPLDWVNVWALAVNEENAAGGRVVTAPTNGAAGIIPAVGHYYMRFQEGSGEGMERYLLAAAAIGVLYKENASISGAEVGCQGEVGVACSMAAAGLVSALGGTNDQVEHAAEIGMEHNLGMTCDPIAGLVQIPCIERNAFGAIKAVNAARMAMQNTTGHRVTLDQVIKTMYDTGMDMQSRYKETSLGGLALNVIEC